MHCSACSLEVAEGSRYCPSCGEPLRPPDVLATRTVVTAIRRTTPRSQAARTALSGASSSRAQGQFAPGDLLGGRYRIVGMLGKGGMGEVYRADDLVLEQSVALKFLPEALARNENALARFRNEVRVARQVSHPNVCRVYDLGEVEGHYFLSMEYVDGEDLGSLLRRIGRLPSDKALEIARRLCAGLAAAHQKGILHRDLKPANVMLDARGEVLLADFGLAGLASEISGDDVRSGTPAYMAPEQLAGQEATVRSDIYSLGLVLYEIFTGKLPFESETLAGRIKEQLESTPVNPSSLVRELEPAVERVILRCLQAKASLRPASALAVAAALPGGDPLAAALAAGETPSPEMVAAAGEGEGLALKFALPLLAAILAAIGVAAFLLHGDGALERLGPEFPPEVLAHKARETIERLGLGSIPAADHAYGFDWDDRFISHSRETVKSPPDWNALLAGKPPLLRFWYRQSPAPLQGGEFHDDLLTPGIVRPDDPAPLQPGMIRLELDQQGRLLSLERIPDQRIPPAKDAAAPDWNALFGAAGLNPAAFQPAEPEWTSLATSDARMAWISAGNHPLRVEAGAMRGKPVFFRRIDPWTQPGQASDSSTSTGDMVFMLVICGIAITVCAGAAIFAHRHLAEGRGDRRGAFRLAAFTFCIQIALWLARAHFGSIGGATGLFFFALCTASFYGIVMWTVYIALEPYVRRRWPQTLISWSSLLIGRWRDPVVGRDVLIGCAMGSGLALLGAFMNRIQRGTPEYSPRLDPVEVLSGIRATAGALLSQIPHGIRETLFFLFIVFLLRALFRNQWIAAAVFAIIWSAASFFGPHGLRDGAISTAINFGVALIMLRWGLLPVAVGIVVSGVLRSAPVTLRPSAWYLGYSLFMLATMLALPVWAFLTAIAGRYPRTRAHEPW